MKLIRKPSMRINAVFEPSVATRRREEVAYTVEAEVPAIDHSMDNDSSNITLALGELEERQEFTNHLTE